MIGCMLCPDVEMEHIADERLALVRQGRRHVLRGGRGLQPAWEKLRDGDLVDIDELTGVARLGANDLEDHIGKRMIRALNMLAVRRMIQFRAISHGRLLCATAAIGQLASFHFPHSGFFNGDRADHAYQISRLACVRREGSDLVVECPHLSVRLTIAAPEVAAVIGALGRPASLRSLVTDLPFVESTALKDILRFLVGSGVVGGVDDDGRLLEDRDPVTAVREFHDVLMHAHSRSGYMDVAVGGTFRFAGMLPPWPAVSEKHFEKVIDLPKPVETDFTSGDPPLGAVMEARRSVRVYGDISMTIGQLAEFLFRVGRIRSIRRTTALTADPRVYDVTKRTYPSGGGAYDIEIYPVIHSCEGLRQGVYHYDPMRHCLELASQSRVLVDQITAGARVSAGISCGPQVLLVLTSRFGRLSWKYEGMAYATTLRNVGVLYEAMYLVATAMRLAPCALGSGNSALFASALGLESMAESSVGEFMLGSLPPEMHETGFGVSLADHDHSRMTE
jgi:oxazoline/thiazoline dehydrogenase